MSIRFHHACALTVVFTLLLISQGCNRAARQEFRRSYATLPAPMENLTEMSDIPADGYSSSTLPTLSFPYLQLPDVSDEEVVASTEIETNPLTDLPPRAMSLSDVVETMLANNLNIQITEIDRRIAEDQIGVEESIFDLLVGGNIATGKNRTHMAISAFDPATGKRISNNSNLPSTWNKQTGGAASVQQLLKSGGTLSLEYGVSRSESQRRMTVPDPTWRDELSFEFAHPLLRRAGSFGVLAGIRIARNNRNIAHQEWRRILMDEVEGVTRRYWDLVFAVNRARVTRLSLEQAYSLLDTNRKKFAVGFMASVDVLQAEAGVASRVEDLILDIQAINEIQDDLKRRMRVGPGHEMWDFAIVPTETPAIEEEVFDVEECLRDAFQRRPELSSLQKRMANLDIDEYLTINDLLPNLNYFLRYSIYGVGGDYYKAQERMVDRDWRSWSTGLEFSYPLQNGEARHRREQSRQRIERTFLEHDRLVEGITQEVRSAMRQVEVARERIETTRAQTEFEVQKLAAELKRNEAGLSTSKDVLDFQEDLAQARSRYLKALIDHRQALIQLDFMRGRILESCGVNEEDAWAELPNKWGENPTERWKKSRD